MTVKNNFILLIYLLFTSSSILLYAQDNCAGSFEIEEIFFNDDIVAYYLSAIDINSGTSLISLFEYGISGDESCYNLDYPSNINLILDFSMKVFSPSMGFNSTQELFNGQIRLSNISSSIIFNNMDLNYSTRSVPGADFSLIDYSGPTDINSGDYQSIVSSVLSSGKIPNGLYTFNFEILTEQGDIVDKINKTINVNEPEYIHLISPGGSVSDTLSNIVYSTFPVFTWNSDDCSSCDMEIRVSEFNAEVHSSPIEAINDVPSLPNVIGSDYYKVNDNINSFQYPTSGSKALEQGKLYAWQLKRIYQSTLGLEEIFSDIYVFKIFNTSIYAENSDLDIIKLLIGDSRYNELFLENGVLSNFNKLEGTITLNGNQISINDLNQIINQIQNANIQIQEVIVE